MGLAYGKFILDTDPGIDDAIAIAVLLAACKERVKLVVSSYGNTSLENTTRNALALLSLLGAADIPVVRGAGGPQPGGNGAYEHAEGVHGGDGLGGLQGGLMARAQGEARGEARHISAIEGDYLRIVYDAIFEESGAVDYITLGPLTNLSALLRRFPDVAGRIGRVVAMGGGIEMGNVTEHAEFNIYCDAESADHVFSAMPDITLATLDATTRIAFGLPQIGEIKSQGTASAEAMASILETNYRLCTALGEPGAVMHDATAVLAYLRPELFEFGAARSLRVLCDKERYGKCVAAVSGAGGAGDGAPNVRIIAGCDPQQILDAIAQSIK